jgi:general stress protein 26
MFSRQRWPIALIAILCIGCERPHQESVPPGIVTAARVAIAELNRASDEAAVLAAARALMLADSNAALITVDPQGQPRARTVFTLLERPDPLDRARGVTAWIMTRAGSRKLDQIRRNPNVTLYYSDDANVSYASIMGNATIHTDPSHVTARELYMAWLPEEGDRRYFWPDFPADFVMIEVRPRWLEYMGQRDHRPDSATWRPQAVVFE